MDVLLSGDAPALSTLRVQFHVAEVGRRDYTGVGFFTRFSVPAHTQRLQECSCLRLTNAAADIEGLAYGAGFVLFVDEGAINFLEGFSFDEPWPDTIDNFRVYVVNESKDET